MGDWPLFLRIKLSLWRWRRKRVQQKFGELFQKASLILFRHDPIGINFEDNTDEYDPEAGTILPPCQAVSHPMRFAVWFDPEIGGDEMRYDLIAKELWALGLTRRSGGRQV